MVLRFWICIQLTNNLERALLSLLSFCFAENDGKFCGRLALLLGIFWAESGVQWKRWYVSSVLIFCMEELQYYTRNFHICIYHISWQLSWFSFNLIIKSIVYDYCNYDVSFNTKLSICPDVNTYRIVSDRVEWLDASRVCEEWGGYLIDIGSEMEQHFIETILEPTLGIFT